MAMPPTNNLVSIDLLQAICDHSDEGILVARVGAGRLSYANTVGCKLFGYTKEELLALTLDRLDPFKTLAAVLGADGTLQHQENAPAKTIVCHRKDGSRFGVNIRIARQTENQIPHIICFLSRTTFDEKDGLSITPTDFSPGFRQDNLHKIFKRIRESEEKFRKVFEESPYGMVLSDAEHRILRANTAFCRLLGYDESELHLHNFSEFLYPDEITVVKGHLKEWELGQSEILKTETRYCTKKKDAIIWAAATVTKIRDMDGALLYNLAILEDITERKQAEKALRESEELFRRLIEGAPEAIYVQTSGRIVFVNSAACHLFGAPTTKDLLGSELVSRIHPDFRHVTQEQIDRTDHEHIPIPPFESIYLKLNNTPVPVEVSAVPVQFHGHSGSLVFVRDITERKRTEEALNNAQKLESIGVLAGGIAHDFNNLLGGLFGNIDLAYAAVEQDNCKEALGSLANAIGGLERARALTRQLLTFAKGGTPVIKPVMMEQVLANSTAFALSGSNVNYKLAIAPDLWLCSGDENQLAQVVDNLVINARQAMPDGGLVMVRAENVILKKGAHPILNPGPYLKIVVQDTGIGIPKELKARIFDPFFSTKEQGSGLGLAIVYSIIKRHQGAIDVESEPTQGTAFNVYLPAAEQQVAPEVASIISDYHDTGDILILDDEPIILSVLSRILNGIGFSPITTLSGDEALRMVRDKKKLGQSFRAAILDLTIRGGRGGREIVGELIQIDPSIKAIVSSGYHDDPVLAAPHEFGFHAKLIKPYSIQEVSSVLQNLFKKPD